MSSFTNPLDTIKVASPCSADWNAMIGNNRQRFCGQCKLNVYNLSGMTRVEAENLLINSEGSVCARFFRRADGTILTKDCPVGWAAVKKRMSRVWTAVASVVITAAAGIGIVRMTNEFYDPGMVMGAIPVQNPQVENPPLMGAITPEIVQPEMGEAVMGDIDLDHEKSMMGKIRVDR